MALINRRDFLRVAGASAGVAAVAACTRSAGQPEPPASPASSAPPPTSVPSTTAPPEPVDWAALRSRVSGGLLLPSDRGFGAAAQPYNAALAEHVPAAIARCRTAADLQACVEAARKAQLPVAARSGGHSYAGYSAPDKGLVLDLAGLGGVEVRPDGTAVVGAGAKLIDVYAALASAGRCLPAGSCPSVGIAGLTLGGGLGVLTRKYGLTCDRVRSMQVVTADSVLRTASAASEPELFWALRGGGGGNLGVVASFEFSTEPAPRLTVCSVRFPAGSAAAVLGAWQEWLGSAPDEFWTKCTVTAGSPPASHLSGCFVGSERELNPLLDQVVRRTGARPAARFVQSKGYLEAMRYFAGSGQPAREGFLASSRVLERPVAEPARVVDLVRGRTGFDLLFDSLGGAVAAVDAGATAFVHRSALATVQVYAKADAASRDRVAGEVAQVQAALADLVGRGAYVNYLDPGQQDWAAAYYGANLPRLRAAAKHYDPAGVFTFAQGLVRA